MRLSGGTWQEIAGGFWISRIKNASQLSQDMGRQTGHTDKDQKNPFSVHKTFAHSLTTHTPLIKGVEVHPLN